MDIFNPFGKILKHENDFKILKSSEENIKNKEKFKEDKVRISLKASCYKAKVKDDEINFNEDSSNNEEMSLFVKCYNKYMKRNTLKHYDKDLVKFRRSNPPRKWEDNKKEERKQLLII